MENLSTTTAANRVNKNDKKQIRFTSITTTLFKGRIISLLILLSIAGGALC